MIITFLFILYSFNYITIRESNIWLYLGSFFDYKYSLMDLFFAYVMTIPFLAYTITNNYKNIFSSLLTLLLLVGVLNGIIIYSLSSESSIYVFIILYVYVIFIFSLLKRKKIIFTKQFKQKTDINIRLFLFFTYFGFIFFLYLMVKYFSILNFSGISNVYIQRALFSSVVNTWEIYMIVFSKYIAAFSALIMALYKKNKFYLLVIIFIFSIDYLLAAHKTSIVLMFFAISYYFYHNYICRVNNLLSKLILCIVLLFTFSINYFIYIDNTYLDIVIGLYDRIFFVTCSLFARFYEYANNYYFFYGGSGLLGKIFSSISIDEAYTFVIGEH